MKQFFFPVTAIVGCAGLAFIVGTQLGIQQTKALSTRPSALNAEAIDQQPKNDLEADCHQQETCGQIGVAEDLTEFQTRLQRIMDRATNEITRLKDENTLQRVEMNPSNAALMNQETQPDAEMNAPDQTIQRDLLKQVVSSSLQPNASASLQPVEAVERNSIEEKNQPSAMPDENSTSVELVDRSDREIQSRQP